MDLFAGSAAWNWRWPSKAYRREGGTLAITVEVSSEIIAGRREVVVDATRYEEPDVADSTRTALRSRQHERIFQMQDLIQAVGRHDRDHYVRLQGQYES